MSDNLLTLKSVYRRFGPIEVLNDLNFAISKGEFVAVVGPSGCGKSTLLNLLSGHDEPTSGTVERSGAVRMVYQHDGLFPWKTVTQNIFMGISKQASEAEQKGQIDDLVKLIGLGSFEHHYPHQLSGGMRQRVELARALAGQSDILLMDEPFSALDYITRLRLRRELSRILKERPRTVVLVTHDIEEAAQLADRVIVLSERPARIQCELRIDVPRPRDLTQSEVVQATRIILTELGLEC